LTAITDASNDVELKLELKLLKRIDHFADTSSFVFEPLEEVVWLAGQYIKMTIDHDAPDSRGTSRIFSISSAPFEKNMVITTRFDFENGSTFKKALRSLKEKEVIVSDKPKGRFTVEGSEKSLLFIAGGIGITPFRSIILDLDSKERDLNMELIYSNRNQEILFNDDLYQVFKKRDRFKLFYIFSPQRIDEDMISRKSSFFKEATVFISGPVQMVKDIRERCEKLGKDKNEIKTDLFIGY
jgi:glycine betaine catabolism B